MIIIILLKKKEIKKTLKEHINVYIGIRIQWSTQGSRLIVAFLFFVKLG